MTEEGIVRDIDWRIAPGKILSIMEQSISDAEVVLDRIAKTPEGEESFDTILEFEELSASLIETLYPKIFLKYVSIDKEQRDAADEAEKESEKFFNKVYARSDLYNVFARVEARGVSLGEEDRVLLEKILQDFRHAGAGLDDEKRMEFVEIANNITVLSSDFNRVLNEITTTVPLTAEDLEGVPPPVYEDSERDGDLYKIPLDQPVAYPVRQYAKNPETRKKIDLALERRGGKENSERLADALALRDRQAKLLGFNTFAEYEISRKMAKVPERVFDFLNDLKQRLGPLRDSEVDVLKKMKSAEEGIPLEDVVLEHYDLWYYHEQLMKEKYEVDQNVVKEYFPMQRVVEGVLDVYQTVLNLEFREVEQPNVWHKDVRQFEVYDKVTGNLMGVFCLDLFPRDGKFKHQAVFGILSRRVKGGKALLPFGSMVGNFKRPSKSQPSLLRHPEVVTFFHEFGHLMHVVTSKAKYASFGLDGVLADFIETPSQMLENWAWEESVLSVISGHYEDPSRKLPPEILKRMIEAKLLDIGAFTMRQVFFALLDMTYHTEAPEDTTSEYLRLLKEITGFRFTEDVTPEAGFGHLMGGYEAGYYSYLWSKVFAEDLFTRFKKSGIMDEKVGLDYREIILAPGGGRNPDDMVREFLGREPNSDAFMESIGLGK
jgi:thimet oligopeptidase